MWTRQFGALRDGDRFFYGNDPALAAIAEVYGIDFRRSLGEVIAANTDVQVIDVPANVFLLDAPTTGDADADETIVGDEAVGNDPGGDAATDDENDADGTTDDQRRPARGERDRDDRPPRRSRPSRRA
jgi:hypothetical protein